MMEHINRGGLRYGKHTRNHLMTDPGPYVHQERSMTELITDALLVASMLAAVAAAVAFAVMSLRF